MRVRRWAMLVGAVLLPVLVAPTVVPAAAVDPLTSLPAGLGETTYPLLDYRGAADPTVVQVGDRWVALSTGRSVPRATAPTPTGPWTDIGSALATLPEWAAGDGIWASDLVRTASGWVLYFSAPVDGLGPGGRCIGAATAAGPLDSFVPLERPLVCPERAVTPPAYDVVRPARAGLPRGTGVIDPEGWTSGDGRRYLLYRTQGKPSSIRMVRLPPSATAPSGQRDSIELLRNPGTVENPVLIQRGNRVVMLTSQGSFVGCGYHTTWRKARSVDKLARARKRILLDSTRTGLCGPGGADLATDAGGASDGLLYLHAWTCPEIASHCPAGGNYDRSPALGSHRAMFAATLAWSPAGVPSVTGFLTPPTNPWSS